MKLSEALKKLDQELFNLNFNYNEQYWELVIFDKEFNILETHTNQYLKTVLENHFNEKIDFKTSNEAYYQDGYRNLYLNYDNTDYSDNFITICLNDKYEQEHHRTKVLNNINDLEKCLMTLNDMFTDYEINLTEIFEEAKKYELYR